MGANVRVTRPAPPDDYACEMQAWCWAKTSADATYRAVVAALQREKGSNPHRGLTPQMMRARAGNLCRQVRDWLCAHSERASALWKMIRLSSEHDRPPSLLEELR